MITEMQEYVSEQRQVLVARARKLSKAPAKSARAVAVGSADTLKQFKGPVRVMARAGVKFVDVSQAAITSLIELESEILTAALTDASTRLSTAAKADNAVHLVRGQVKTLRSSGERIVSDANRAVEIVKDAGQDIRKLATHAYNSVVQADDAAKPKAKTTRKAKRVTRKAAAKPAARKAKRVVRKSAAAKPVSGKAVVRRRKKVAKPIPASRWEM